MEDMTRLLEVLEKLSERLDRHSEILNSLEKSIVQLQVKDQLTSDHEQRIRALESDAVKVKVFWAFVAFIISAIVSLVAQMLGR